jgi:hypothetical protein
VEPENQAAMSSSPSNSLPVPRTLRVLYDDLCQHHVALKEQFYAARSEGRKLRAEVARFTGVNTRLRRVINRLSLENQGLKHEVSKIT